MNIPYDLIAAFQPEAYRDNVAASKYAHERIRDYSPVLPAEFVGPSDLDPHGSKATWLARTVRKEILRLKREKDGPR